MNIRIIEEGNRLHLVFEGTNGSLNEAIKAFIKSIAGSDVPETKVNDFEDISDSSEIESEIIAEKTKDAYDVSYEKFLELFRNGREKYYYSSINNYSSMSDEDKLIYSIAFKTWVKEYYAVDPYEEVDKKYENLKNHRGFFKVFAKMLPDEIASAEKQLGIEAGKFADYASNEEILSVFELCRQSLLERANN